MVMIRFLPIGTHLSMPATTGISVSLLATVGSGLTTRHTTPGTDSRGIAPITAIGDTRGPTSDMSTWEAPVPLAQSEITDQEPPT